MKYARTKTRTVIADGRQAVHLPEGFANDEADVEVVQSGNVATVRPVEDEAVRKAEAVRKMREAVALLRSMPKPETIELLDRTQSRDTLDDL